MIRSPRSSRLLAWGWMLALLAGMSIPAADLPIPDLLSADKLLHFGGFFVLTLLWIGALGGRWHTRALGALGIGVAYGVFTELYQGWMPLGRTADVYDALADALGCLAALGAHALLARRGRPSPRPKRAKENAPSNSSSLLVS